MLKAALHKLTLFLVLGLTLRASANTEETVQSIFGGAPYMIVIEDSRGSSSRSPGLYSRDQAGTWKLALGGHVSLPAKTGGVSSQLHIAEKTGRFESIALVDGVVTVFTIYSNQEDPTSYISLKNEPHLQPIYPMNGSRVRLPKLNSAEELSVYEKTVIVDGKDVSVVLISVKYDGPLGNGITFAMIVDANPKTNAELRLSGEPILLDWKWSSAQELSTRLITGLDKPALVSEILLNELSRERASGEPKVVADWRSSVKQLVGAQPRTAIALNKFTTPGGKHSFPYFDLNGKLQIDSLPYLEAVKSSFNGMSVYDPISGKHGFFINKSHLPLSELESQRPFVSGSLSCDSSNCVILDASTAKINPGGGTNQTYLTKTDDGRVFFFATVGESRWENIVLPPTGGTTATPKKISWYMTPDYKFVLVSRQYEKGGQTDAYEVESSSTGINIVKSGRIADVYYDKQALSVRLMEYQGVFAFDHVTPIETSSIDYSRTHRKTAPHVNVAATLQTRSIREYYPDPLSRITLTPRLKYFEYESSKTSEIQSGLYLTDNGDSKLLTQTQLLIPSSKISENVIFSKDEGYFLGGETSTTFLFLGDRNFEKGANTYSAYFAISPTASTSPVEVFEIPNIESSVSDLEFLDVVYSVNHLRKAPQAYLAFIYSVKGKGTFVKVAKVKRSGPNKIDFELRKDTLAGLNLLTADKMVSPADTKRRIVFDREGLPHWIKTPDIDPSNSGFRLVNMLDGTVINPHQTNNVFSKVPVGREIEDSKVASWRIWPGFKEENEKTFGPEFKTDLFADFRQVLDDLANPKLPPRRVVLIVPEELKQYAESYPKALRTREELRPQFWSDRNRNLSLFIPNKKVLAQEEYIDNLNALNETAKENWERPFLLSSLSLLVSEDRPKPSDSGNAFVLKESTVGGVQLGKTEGGGSTKNISPHFLYLIATEGNKIPLSEFRQQELTPHFSTLLIGTESEWKNLISDKDIEHGYDLKDKYEVIHLAPPTFEMRQKFLLDFLNKPEIQAFGYSIDAKSFSKKADSQDQSEAKKLLASYFVRRTETKAQDIKESVFESYMKAINKFISEVQTNSGLRQKHVLDRGAVDGILSKIFPMVINKDLQPANDYLNRLSRRDATHLWRQMPHAGPLKTKEDIIKAILSQLTPEKGRGASSSIFVLGESKSGKTYLWKSLFKMLELKEYSFTASEEENDGAWVLFIDCAMIDDESGTSKTGGLTTDAIFKHIDTFLTSTHGNRGFIVFDDLHVAPPAARSRLLQRIRQFLENPTSVIQKSSGNSFETVPNQNITIVGNINPTKDLKKIAQFAKNKDAPTTEELIFATLATSDQSIETSWLKRFAKIIRLDVNPEEAKMSQIFDRVTEASKNAFNNNQVLTFLSPEAAHLLIDKFPKTDARTFSNSTLGSLIQLNQDKGGLIIDVPHLSRDDEGAAESPAEDEGAAIEAYINKNIERVSVENSVRGKIEFTRYVLDTIRKLTFEALLRAMSEDPRFASEDGSQRIFDATPARAIYDHLKAIPYYPVDGLRLDPRDFGATNSNSKQQFRSVLSAISEHQKILNKGEFPQVGVPEAAPIYDQFIKGLTAAQERTRQHMLKEAIDGLTPITSQLTAKVFRVNDLKTLPDPDHWLMTVDKSDPDLSGVFGNQLVEKLIRYSFDMFRKNIFETQSESKIDEGERMSQYDAIRFFAMAIDKSLASLPLGTLSGLLVKALSKATSDLSYGQNPGLQNLLFESKVSPLIPLDMARVTGHGEFIPTFEHIGAPNPERLANRFNQNCFERLGQLRRGSRK